MGASLVVREHEWCDRAKLSAWVKRIQDQDAYESGNSYSGQWNMAHGLSFDESKVYDSISQAHEYISENQDKWGPLFAVPAMHQPRLDWNALNKDEKYKELVKARSDLELELRKQDSDIVKRAREAKSQFKGCTGCGSKISAKHVRSVRCPVCDANLLRTPTDDKKAEALKKKIDGIGEKLKARQLLLEKKAKLPAPHKVWVVGGWCAS